MLTNPVGARVLFDIHTKLLAIALSATDTKNRKVSPNTLLYAVYKGSMVEPEEGQGDFPFELTGKTFVYSKELSKIVEMKKLVKDHHPTVTTIWSYPPFAPGLVPGSIVRNKPWSFRLDDRQLPLDALTAAKIGADVELRWVIELDQKTKKLCPLGLAAPPPRRGTSGGLG